MPAPEQRIDYLKAKRAITVDDIASSEKALAGLKQHLADLDQQIANEQIVPEPLPVPEI